MCRFLTMNLVHRLQPCSSHSPPIFAARGLEEFVVFLENLPEAGEIQGLIVLQQDEHQVELAEGQFQIVTLAVLHALSVFLPGSLDQTLRQDSGQRGESSGVRRATLQRRRVRLLVRFARHDGRFRSVSTRLFDMSDFILQLFPTSQGPASKERERGEGQWRGADEDVLGEFLGEEGVDLRRFFLAVLKARNDSLEGNLSPLT